MNVTSLRKQIYRVIDQVLQTDVPVEIERNGKNVVIMPANAVTSKLTNLKPRKGIVGDPDTLVDVKVGEWREPRDLS
ncbi:MAG: type II toxin-antitoxin system Phd/YefM family antitoxin [Gammaproteobacteria bacterium]